jgi:hypothetical protein
MVLTLMLNGVLLFVLQMIKSQEHLFEELQKYVK